MARQRVVLTFAQPYAPGVRLLDALPIYPKHALEAAWKAGNFAQAWGLKTTAGRDALPRSVRACSYTPGQRVVLGSQPALLASRRERHGAAVRRSPHAGDRAGPQRRGAAARLGAGRRAAGPDSRGRLPRGEAGGRRRARAAHRRRARSRSLHALVQPGPQASRDASRRFLLQDDFRQAVSLAVSGRDSPMRCTSARPIRRRSRCRRPTRTGSPPAWTAPAYDPARASALLDGLGLLDRDHDGVREDAAGHPVRFSVLVQVGADRGAEGNGVRARPARARRRRARHRADGFRPR